MSSVPRHLFVYGTLLPGLAPPIIADVVNTLRIIGDATVPGRLYDLGDYPGCVIADGCDSLIHGKLLEIPNAVVLDRLDWYECYAAHDEAGSLFVRTICEATNAGGEKIFAWIYVYNRDLAAARRIVSGNWSKK
jgi:gamma-glutamylcyclotransferase (GGCT)/AIG2-like uncharacterized protein YtfP